MTDPCLTLPRFMLLALLGVGWLAPTAARADGAMASVEAGALLDVTLRVDEVDRGESRRGGVDGDATWLIGVAVEWALGETVRVGGELWLARPNISTRSGDVEQSAGYGGLAPRLRLVMPLPLDIDLDLNTGVGTGYLSGYLSKGSLAFAWRVGVGLGYRLSPAAGVFINISHYATTIWPIDALTSDSVVHVYEPLLVGFDTTMLTVGIRALE